jgi:8-oxo-dGTP diphosphatase
MNPGKRFNVRVYGLWLKDGQVLVCDEYIKGHRVLKFPGGGLEMGEGMIDCLKREWQEELFTTTEVLDHFYTTDFYQPSAYDDSQVISIYYLVAPHIPEGYELPQSDAEKFLWLPVDEALPSKITLPIDVRVAEMLAGNKSKVESQK